MYDSTTPDAIPRSAPAVAGYVGGYWPNYPEDVKRWPHAHHLSIAVNAGEDAMCLDVEKGDATPQDAPGWYHRQRARGVAKPYLYASLSPWGELRQIMEQAGIARSSYFAWAADYTHAPHIPEGFDACQWTDKALDRNLDESLCGDEFFRVIATNQDDLSVLEPAERRLVNTYEHYIRHLHLHEHGLKVTIAAMVHCRKVIWMAAQTEIQRGRPPHEAWAFRNRAARYKLLLDRTR
jgi:hypothetical protein